MVVCWKLKYKDLLGIKQEEVNFEEFLSIYLLMAKLEKKVSINNGNLVYYLENSIK